MQWWVWKDSNLQCSKELRVYGPVGRPVAPTHPTFGGEGASRTRKPRGHAPLQTGSACHMPNLSKNHGGSGASRTRKPRRYVPLRTGWAFHMPNTTVTVGAGLEPAHASRREPRLRRGAIPFRSSYRSITIWRRRSDSNGWRPPWALRVSSAAP
jgi:hypothetical protein